MNAIYWGLAVVSLVAVAGWKAWREGPRQAVGWATVLSLIVPVWISLEILNQPINMRIAGAIAALTIYVFHRQSTFRTRLVLIDLAMIGLVAVHLMSDWWNEGFSTGVILRAYGEWLVAYLAGRVAIQSLDDMRGLTPVVVVVICVLAIAAIVEATCHVNLFEEVVGKRPWDHTPHHQMRWGIKRAYGTTMHPIFFGTVQLLLFPWSLYAASRAFRHRSPGWWRVLPVVSALGIVSAASRAPVLAMAIAPLVGAVLYLDRWRKTLAFGGVAVAVLAGIYHTSVIDGLDQWDQWGKKKRWSTMVEIDGEKKEYNSTLHRIRILEIYRPAMARAGVLGFGTTATTNFPLNLPLGPQDVKTLKRVWTIENSYVLMLLRFGYMGVFCFAMLGIATVGTFGWMSLRPQTQGRVFLAGAAGTIAGYLLVIATVWNSHDFSFWYLWTAGAGAGLLAHRRRSGFADSESEIDSVAEDEECGDRATRPTRLRLAIQTQVVGAREDEAMIPPGEVAQQPVSGAVDDCLGVATTDGNVRLKRVARKERRRERT